MHTNEMAVAMLPRVEKIARGFARKLPQHIELDDLIQVGVVGMLQAIAAYQDSGKAVESASVAAYVERRIRGAIQDELRAQDPLTRDERKDARRVTDATKALEGTLGRRPDAHEIAASAKLSVARVRALAERTLSIMPEQLAEDLLPCDGLDALELLTRTETWTRLVAAIDSLADRQRTVVGLYYLEGLSLNEIAKMLGVTESRVCQISSDAVRKIRIALADA